MNDGGGRDANETQGGQESGDDQTKVNLGTDLTGSPSDALGIFPTYLPKLKHVYGVQALVVAVCGLGLFFWSPRQLPGFLGGALVMTLNFVFFVELWRGILAKKHIARTFAVVVIKYAVLGAVLYIFVREWRFPLVPLIAGLTTLLGTILIVALQTHLMNRS